MPEIPRFTASGQVRTGGRPFGGWREEEDAKRRQKKRGWAGVKGRMRGAVDGEEKREVMRKSVMVN